MDEAKLLRDVEARLDADYEATFPREYGWEMGALLLLFGHNTHLMLGREPRSPDDTKYGLMRALRLGQRVPSAPLCSAPTTVSAVQWKAARDGFGRGLEYFEICDAFMMYCDQVIPLVSVTRDKIQFGPNPDWKAFDVLDQRMSEGKPRPTAPPELTAGIKAVAEAVLKKTDTSTLRYRFADPDRARMRGLMPLIRQVFSAAYSLPKEWRFDAIRVRALRRAWDAMYLLAWIHRRVAECTHRRGHPHFGRLMIWPRAHWIQEISACAQLDEETTARILQYHTYDRAHRDPDIALTPFLPIGAGLLAADPRILLSSSVERNFCAHVARNYRDLYDKESHLLASKMASDLSSAFQGAGFCAATSIPVKTREGDTDIDLLVWSEQEQYLLAAELKSVIPTGDFMEVVNRGESRALEAFRERLPKYAAALTDDASGLVARAFHLRAPPAVSAHCSILIMRGYVGSPRLRAHKFPFVSEDLLQGRLKQGTTLRELVDWCTQMPYLPREGEDFFMEERSIKSPSGIVVLTYRCGFRV